jgi:hypothetical protein
MTVIVTVTVCGLFVAGNAPTPGVVVLALIETLPE